MNSWDLALAGHFSEADTADAEIAHVAMLAAATETAPNDPGGKLRGFLRASDYGGLGHVFV